MIVIRDFEPFSHEDYYIKARMEFKGLPNLIVSGNSFVQLPYFKNKRTQPLKILQIKQSQRLQYIFHEGRKISRSELNSRKLPISKNIKVGFCNLVAEFYQS